MDQAKRPADFTGLWVERLGVNARWEQEYVGGVANGAYRSILENGVVHREGWKKNGLWHGTLIVRDCDGNVLDTSEFVEGTGVYHIFNSAGQMTDEVPLLRGKMHGVVRCWCRGELVHTAFYNNGVCDACVFECCLDAFDELGGLRVRHSDFRRLRRIATMTPAAAAAHPPGSGTLSVSGTAEKMS